MASADSNSCAICMHAFNETDHKSVVLPCSHDSCLTCLVRLKTAGNDKCPKCRGDWAEVEVQGLPGMALGAGAVKEEEVDMFDELKKKGTRCRKHELHYEFWSNKEREFYCKKCVIELGPVHSELQLIEDAVPMIKSHISDKVLEVNEIVEVDLEAIGDFYNHFMEKIKHVSKFRGKMQSLEEKMNGLISIAEVSRCKRISDLALAKKLDEGIEKINSEADIAIMVSCAIATLEDQKQLCCLPALHEEESLLCDIACTFTDMEAADGLSSSAAFISSLLEVTENLALPLAKTAFDADKLMDGDEWALDNTNCLAAVLALVDRQPRHISLRARHDEVEPLPAEAVAAVINAACGCEVWLELYHSFLKPEHPNTDQELLDKILENRSLRLASFYGHLDEPGIAGLPTSVTFLGLAIDSKADASAVSSIEPWNGLQWLRVSVGCNVAVSDLNELPSVEFIGLHFPGLIDARVDSVRPAIEALVSDREFQYVAFPLSHLSGAGARRLLKELRGLSIEDVTIEARGTWQPGMGERKLIEKEFHSAVGCSNVDWHMDWLYKP